MLISQSARLERAPQPPVDLTQTGRRFHVEPALSQPLLLRLGQRLVGLIEQSLDCGANEPVSSDSTTPREPIELSKTLVGQLGGDNGERRMRLWHQPVVATDQDAFPRYPPTPPKPVVFLWVRGQRGLRFADPRN